MHCLSYKDPERARPRQPANNAFPNVSVSGRSLTARSFSKTSEAISLQRALLAPRQFILARAIRSHRLPSKAARLSRAAKAAPSRTARMQPL